MNPELIESIELMTVNGNRLELPKEQLDNYVQVKKCLTNAGGKYKKNGFDFTVSAADVKARLVGGEAVNDKKKYQAFFTPAELAGRMVEKADIEHHHECAEPSAGQGAIARLLDDEIDTVLTCIELMPENAAVLRRKGFKVWEEDYLRVVCPGHFDRIVANPPFTKGQDIIHIRKMYADLKPGGRLVTLSSPGWRVGALRKQVAFREWLEELDAEVEEIADGTFKESGTNIRTLMITIDKPEVE